MYSFVRRILFGGALVWLFFCIDTIAKISPPRHSHKNSRRRKRKEENRLLISTVTTLAMLFTLKYDSRSREKNYKKMEEQWKKAYQKRLKKYRKRLEEQENYLKYLQKTKKSDSKFELMQNDEAIARAIQQEETVSINDDNKSLTLDDEGLNSKDTALFKQERPDDSPFFFSPSPKSTSPYRPNDFRSHIGRQSTIFIGPGGLKVKGERPTQLDLFSSPNYFEEARNNLAGERDKLTEYLQNLEKENIRLQEYTEDLTDQHIDESTNLQRRIKTQKRINNTQEKQLRSLKVTLLRLNKALKQKTKRQSSQTVTIVKEEAVNFSKLITENLEGMEEISKLQLEIQNLKQKLLTANHTINNDNREWDKLVGKVRDLEQLNYNLREQSDQVGEGYRKNLKETKELLMKQIIEVKELKKENRELNKQLNLNVQKYPDKNKSN